MARPSRVKAATWVAGGAAAVCLVVLTWYRWSPSSLAPLSQSERDAARAADENDSDREALRLPQALNAETELALGETPRERLPATVAPGFKILFEISGEPASGAQVSLHRRQPDALDSGTRRTEWIGTSHLTQGPIALATADIDGSVRLEELPSLAENVWILITHPEAVPFLALLPNETPATGPQVRLTPRPPTRVECVYPDGSPAPNANIVQSLAFDAVKPEGGAWEFHPPLVRRTAGDEQGWAWLPSPGQRSIVQAELAGRRSLPYYGEAEATLRLELPGTFTLLGRVTSNSAEAPTPREALVVARGFASGATSSQTLASTRLRSDGTFGPIQVPLASHLERLDARLDFSTSAPREVDLGTPQPGQEVRVEFLLLPSGRRDLRVLDAADSTPLGGAFVQGYWQEDERWCSAFADTDPSGWARLHLPIGTSPGLLVRLAGYAPYSAELAQVDGYDRDHERIVYLHRESTLALRVEHRATSVPDYEVWLWQEPYDGHIEHTSVQNARDGTHRWSGLSPGRWWVRVATEDGVAPPRSLELLSGAETEITVQLEGPARIEGRIVDRASGRPVSNGQALTVDRTSSGAMVAAFAYSEPTGEDGAFLLSDVPPGSAELYFSAAGFGPRTLRIDLDAHESRWLGDIGLDRARSVWLELDPGGAELTGGFAYRPSGNSAEDLPFDATGRLAIPITDGRINYRVVSPLRDVTQAVLPPLPSDVNRIQIDCFPQREAWLYLDWPESLSAPAAVTWFIDYVDRRGHPVRRSGTAEGTNLRMSGLPAGPVTVAAFAENLGVLAKAELELQEEAVQVIRLQADATSPRVRLLDSKLQPLAHLSCRIVPLAAGQGHAGSVNARTDADGTLRLGSSGANRIGIGLDGGDSGIRGWVEVELSAQQDSVQDVRLPTPAGLQLSPMDGSTPLDDVPLLLQDPHGRADIWLKRSDALGHAHLEQLLPGNYRLSIPSSTYAFDPTQVVVGPGNNAIHIDVRRRGSFELLLAHPEGPASGATIQLESLDFDWLNSRDLTQWMDLGLVPVQSLSADSGGRLTLSGLPRGRYSLRASHMGFEVEAQVEVVFGSSPSYPLFLE